MGKRVFAQSRRGGLWAVEVGMWAVEELTHNPRVVVALRTR